MEVLRYAAFTDDPRGGNPAGVVLDATGADDADMLAEAAAVGYSETAFLAPTGDRAFDVRYFSPRAEVSFCGHATIAAAVALAMRSGPAEFRFSTQAGMVLVSVTVSDEPGRGRRASARLVSVSPRTVPLAAGDLSALLAALRWGSEDLHPALPARVGFAGAWHPIIAARTRTRLADLDYDFRALGDLMHARDWTTVQLIWRESADLFHARNPFPPGGVIEDPATGAAAAALGGYLRELRLVDVPATVTIRQGEDLGRPGVLTVEIPPGQGGIAVAGAAVEIV